MIILPTDSENVLSSHGQIWSPGIDGKKCSNFMFMPSKHAWCHRLVVFWPNCAIACPLNQQANIFLTLLVTLNENIKYYRSLLLANQASLHTSLKVPYKFVNQSLHNWVSRTNFTRNLWWVKDKNIEKGNLILLIYVLLLNMINVKGRL